MTARCLMSDGDRQAVEKAQKCLSNSSSEQTALTQCFGALLPPEILQQTECLVGRAGSPKNVIGCFTSNNVTARKVAKGFDCATRKNISTQEAAACAAVMVGGDAAMIAACATSSADSGAALACMLKDKPELNAARQAYECASNATSAAAIVAYCSGDNFDPKAKAMAACVANGGADFKSTAATCAASALVPPQLANVVGCATKSTGAIDATLCIAAPSMNAELRMAMECASSTGGEPVSFVSCTAGRLTMAELTKCLSGRVGESCFGPGNTLVTAFNTVGNDLKNGLGESNDIVQAVKGVERFVADAGKSAGKAWDSIFGPGSHWCRGDLTGWTCPGETSDWCRGDLTGWSC